MHRELSHTDSLIDRPSNAGLYLFTGLLSALLVLDLWPLIARWLTTQNWGIAWPTWEREFYGYRYCLIGAALGGVRALFHSLEALSEKRLAADLAVAIACIAAIYIREFLEAHLIVLIGLVGECLEAFTFARAQQGIRKLVEVIPRKCWVLREGQEVAVYTQEVRIGERVVVKPGRKVPVDGVVVDGRSAVDASPLTGESVPLDKGIGDEVLAGSVNQFGQLIVEAQKVAEQTVAGRVIDLTAKALKDKPAIVREVDRYARYFVPAVLGLALLTFILNVVYQAGPFRPEPMRLGLSAAIRFSIYPTVGVLVVACPCALVLATPAAIIAAIGRLAGTGVLIKGGSVLERLATVRTIAFDKTGTLTEGRLELGDVIPLGEISEEELLRIAASTEQPSEHPLAQVLVQAARQRSLSLGAVSAFQTYPGAGVGGEVEGRKILVGTRRLMEEQGIAIPLAGVDALARLDAAGQSSLYVAREGVVLGLVGARDRIRVEAADLVAELRNSGIPRIMMLTGDRKAPAQVVAEQLRISEVHAELLPIDKATHLHNVGTTEGGTCFVGDGINDAPALARASVGIAVGSTGSDIAAEAGDVVLMGEPLRHLPLLIRLSRETMTVIRQNIVRFAFAVNLVGVVIVGILWPLFATSPEWYDKSPLFGVIYHQIGSILVLLNSMRLLGFERVTTSVTWRRWSDRFASIDLWLQRNFNVDTVLHAISHRWKWILVAVVVSGILIWLASGFTAIAVDEVGVVKHFGRMESVLEPGLHYRWPWPIERIVKLRPNEIKTVGLGYRSASEEGDEEDAVSKASSTARKSDVGQGTTWTSTHGGTEGYENEAAMLTGDGNLVEILATVSYQIDDPHRYLLSAKQRKPMIRSATESVLREVVAGQVFLDLLTSRRAEFEEDVRRRLQKRLRELAPEGLGIRLVAVTIHDLHPPREVVESYYLVPRAAQERDRRVHQAHAEAGRILRDARERELREGNAGLITKDDVIGKELAEMAHVTALMKARRFLAPDEDAELLAGVMIAIARGASAEQAVLDYWIRHHEILALRRAMIEFRLGWEALTELLRRRDKVIVDADQVKGRRQILLADPEWFRPQVVVPTPPRSRDDGP